MGYKNYLDKKLKENNLKIEVIENKSIDIQDFSCISVGCKIFNNTSRLDTINYNYREMIEIDVKENIIPIAITGYINVNFKKTESNENRNIFIYGRFNKNEPIEPSNIYQIGLYIPEDKSLNIKENLILHNLFANGKETAIIDAILELIISEKWFANKRRNKAKTSIGMDIEFEAIDINDMYIDDASKFISDLSGKDKIGLDGCSFIGELRPEHINSFSDKSINKLVNNIKNLLYDLRFKYKIGANLFSLQNPTGAHIHIRNLRKFYNEEEIYKICKKLDRIYYYLPSINARLSSKYNRKTAYELKSDNGRFEYRSLPSYIYLTPTLLKTVLKSVRLILQGKKIKKTYVKYFKKIFNYIANNCNNYGYDIIKRWLRKDYDKLKKEPNLYFINFWNTNVMNIIDKCFEEITKKYNLVDINLMFDGLKRERGNVYSGFKELDIMEEINCKFLHNTSLNLDIIKKNSFVFYFPYWFRYKVYDSFLEKDFYMRLMEEIINKVKNLKIR